MLCCLVPVETVYNCLLWAGVCQTHRVTELGGPSSSAVLSWKWCVWDQVVWMDSPDSQVTYCSCINIPSPACTSAMLGSLRPAISRGRSPCWLYRWVGLAARCKAKMDAAAAAAATKSLQSCPTLCDPIDGSPPGAPVPGILQERTLEWVAMSFSNA